MSALEIADIIGILAFSVSGFLIAVHYNFDLLGICISSFLTALGGGIIRDAITNQTPYIFTNTLPISLVIATIFFATIFKLQKINNLEGKTFFIVSDAIGLVSFAISGSLIAIGAEFNFFGTLILAFITAVGGGTIRDILINRVPSVLVSEFYGTVAIIVGITIYLLNYFKFLDFITIIVVFISGVLLRLLAYYFKWNLPKLS